MTRHRQVNHVINLNNNSQVFPKSNSKNLKIHLQYDHYIIKDNNNNIIKVKLMVYHIQCDTNGVIVEYRDSVKHDTASL